MEFSQKNLLINLESGYFSYYLSCLAYYILNLTKFSIVLKLYAWLMAHNFLGLHGFHQLQHKWYKEVYSRGCWSSGRPSIIAALTNSANSASLLSLLSIGSCTMTLQIPCEDLRGNIQLTGWALPAPTIDKGMIGAPTLLAILYTPFLKGRRRPSLDRVPSGNAHRWIPSWFQNDVI